MKAVLCKSLDGPDALETGELPGPVPGPGEVVIRVSACALNFFDTLIVRGKYQTKPALPFSPGGEVAGRVARVGSGVEGLSVGQRVAAYPGFNGCREEIVAPAGSVIALPEGIPDEVAAAVPVLGATGGAGLAAVEVAMRLGANAVAAGTSDEKLKICSARGAKQVLNLTAGDVKGAIRSLNGGKGPDLIYDCIGGPYAEPALRSIAWGGRYLVVGFAAGEIPKIPLNLVLLKGCELVGVFWGRHAREDPVPFRKQLARLMDWCAKGEIRPHIDHVFPLEKTGEAIKLIEERKIKGKIVIKP
jgi:NADPH:quinone reductase